MSEIQKPLKKLTEYPQWVTWKSIPRDNQPKPAKVPYDPTTNNAIDPHNPANWHTATEALALAEAHGLGVGFVLTANDPFFFLDIDNCINGAQWNDIATEAFAAFPGAAFEISHSGKGAHIIGCGRVPDGYKKRNDSLGLELYTQDRFIAIPVDNPCGGNAWGDYTEHLARYVPTRFKPSVEVLGNADWNCGPRPEYNGPADDDQLIDKMLRSGGAANFFGGKATVVQLWNADAQALGEFFPDGHGNKPFDHSSADAALMSHLAFWTGADPQRMDRLFRRSGLMREKYEARPDYRSSTVLGAVARCKNVYAAGDRGGSVTEVGITPAPSATRSTVMTVSEQEKYFENCCYIASMHRVFMPNGEMLKPETFNAVKGGYHFVIDIDGKAVKKAFEAFTENKVVQFPKVHRTCFRPELGERAIIEEDGVLMLSTYIKPNPSATHGDATPFLNHMQKLFPDERDRKIMLCYMASLIRNPGVKFQWSPVIQGAEGNGKSVLMRIMQYAITPRYCHFPNAQDIGGNGSKFNGWIEGKLFIGIEEIYTRDRFEVVEALKPMITNDRIEIQKKAMDQVTGDNRANFMMCTNHKDAIHKSRNDRRYAVFYTPQQTDTDLVRDGMSGDYFPALYNWLNNGGYAITTGYLQSYDIDPQYDPAVLCHRAPTTSSTEEVLQQSYGAVEQEVLEAIMNERDGFRGGFISSYHLDKMLKDANLDRRIPRNKRKDMLETLGYVQHPSLPKGRVTALIFGEEGRPVLYVRRDLAGIVEPDQYGAVQQYLLAQNRGGSLTEVGQS